MNLQGEEVNLAPALNTDKRKEKRNQPKKRRRKWPWMIWLVTLSLVTVGFTGAIVRFGWVTVEQAAILGYTLLFPYTPSNKVNTIAGPWTHVPGLGDNIGHLRIPALNMNLPIVQGTFPGQTKQIGHFAGSTLPGEGGNAILISESQSFVNLQTLHTGEKVEWTAPQGTFVYQVTGIHLIASVGSLSNINQEQLTMIFQPSPQKSGSPLLAVFARPVSPKS